MLAAAPDPAPRLLVVNADDFGFTRDVNAGIVEAHTKGILTATTLMANGAAFDDAVRLAKEHPSLDVGCHLVLAGGVSVLNHKALPASVRHLVQAVALRRIRVYDELRAQVARLLQAGLQPTHLDTHKHTHLLPPVLDAVARVAQEFRIGWVRRPFDFPLTGQPNIPWAKRATSRGLQFIRARFHRVLAEAHCLTTDHFAGFQITGRFRVAELTWLIKRLPPGTTELMCHPGRCTDELLHARTRLKKSREEELEALTAAETRAALQESAVRLTNFRELGGL